MNILVFAPHNDDEVLGVGGTIKRHVLKNDDVFVCEVTSGTNYITLQHEAKKAHDYLGIKDTFFLNKPVGQLKTMNQMELNRDISRIVEMVQPVVVYIPFLGDMHIDHREVSDSAMVALRPIGNYSVRKIYMYETLSETGWNIPTNDNSFVPNAWVDISETIEDKICAMRCYESQLCDYPHPRSEQAIRALAQYRGAIIGVEYAESFMLVRSIDK